MKRTKDESDLLRKLVASGEIDTLKRKDLRAKYLENFGSIKYSTFRSAILNMRK